MDCNNPYDLRTMVADQVKVFTKNIPVFAELRKVIIATLQDKTAGLSGSPLIHGRVKQVDSFAEKCIRKCEKYPQPAWQLTDLCGVRVVVNSLDAIPAIRRCIEDNFLILEDEDTSGRLGDMEFGYQSIHYIVALDPAKSSGYSTSGRRIPEKLFAARTGSVALKKSLPAGPVYKAEIQVRSLLQHAWSDAIHDNLYKTEMKRKPHHLLRESALVAALLEDADNSIVKLIKGADQYRSYYGAYMEPEEIEHEIEIQKVVLDSNPDNRNAALKIARLSDCLGKDADTKRVEGTLAPFEKSGDPALLRELGMVRLKNRKKATGRKNIVKSTEMNPDDPDTWCELGLTYFQHKDYGQALKYYEKAFEVDPDYPRALMRFIECKILDGSDGSLEFLPLIKQNLERAIDISYRRIATGIHIPHAWYDIGFFALLLNRPDESIEAYGKAILTTSSKKIITGIYDSLTAIHGKVRHKNIALNDGIRLVRSYLRVVLTGRFNRKPHVYLSGCDDELDGFKTLSPCYRDGKKSVYKKGKPVVIVAGSCSQGSEVSLDGYERIIEEAFEGFNGIICSGGTDAGISGVIGRLTNLGGQAVRLGYLPKGESCMKGYECIYTMPGDFSVYEPVMMWSDILAAGIAPNSVRVIGVGGGAVSCLEYQLALLVGAQVGIISDSGGTGSTLLKDRDWLAASTVPSHSGNSKKQLLGLPADTETLRAFIYPTFPSKLIRRNDRETIARGMHEKYTELMQQDIARRLQNLADWKELDATFRDANYGFVDHIDQKLQRIGLTLRKITGAKPARHGSKIEARIERKKELLAKMEHGRWVIDRLEDGWRLGERDEEKKTRPQLIPWGDLDSSETEKDYNAITELPEILADLGYEIIAL